MRYIEKLRRITAGEGGHGRRKSRNWKRRQLGKLAFGLALIMGMTHFQPVLASKVDQANDKKNEAQQGLNSANSEIEKIEKQQQELQAEINALDQDLGDVIVSLGILENDLATAQERLVQVQEDLEQAKEDEAAQYEAMKKRIRFMYERGDTAYLTSILESKSMADLLNRVEYVNEVYDYDRQLLVEYQTTKLQVAELEVEVESEIAEMEELQASYRDKQQQYETLIAQKQEQMGDFDSKLADVKALAAQMQATIEKQNEIIRQEEERQRREEEERRRQEANNSSNQNSGSSGGSNPAYKTDIDPQKVVDFACQFVGNPYVYGGNDINNGIDCSGFTKYVFAHFGITLPRYSGDQRKCGQAVSYNNAKPGDLIFYEGHVAIYIGNGQIVHASNSKPYPVGGIKISTATYREILAVRRML